MSASSLSLPIFLRINFLISYLDSNRLTEHIRLTHTESFAEWQKAGAGCTSRAFKHPGHDVTAPDVWPSILTDYTYDSELDNADGVPLASRRSSMFPEGNWWPSRAHQQDREKIDCRVNLSWYVKPNWEGKKYPQHPEVYDWWRREVVSKLEFRWICLKWRLCWFFLTSTNGKKISSEQIRHIIISYCHKLTFSSRRRTCIVLFIPLAADNQSSVPIHTIAILVIYSLYRGSIGREHSFKAK